MHQEVLGREGQKIFFQLKHFSDFYLAGGTALALQIGHRLSADFDLFSDQKIMSDLLGTVKSVFGGKEAAVSVNNSEELTVFVEGVKISFVHYPFPPLLDLIRHDGVNLLNSKEIAATKAYVIGRRGFYKDYVDLYFIVANGISSLMEIISLAEKKYGDEFNGRLFLEQIIYLEDVEESSLVFLKEKIVKEAVQKFFEDKIREIKL